MITTPKPRITLSLLTATGSYAVRVKTTFCNRPYLAYSFTTDADIARHGSIAATMAYYNAHGCESLATKLLNATHVINTPA